MESNTGGGAVRRFGENLNADLQVVSKDLCYKLNNITKYCNNQETTRGRRCWSTSRPKIIKQNYIKKITIFKMIEDIPQKHFEREKEKKSQILTNLLCLAYPKGCFQ